MRLHVVTRGCMLSPRDDRRLAEHIRHLENRLQNIDPDLVHLEVVIEKEQFCREYNAQVRLAVLDRVLPPMQMRAPSPRHVLRHAFRGVSEALTRIPSVPGDGSEHGGGEPHSRGTRMDP
jgi:hypothetical protein